MTGSDATLELLGRSWDDVEGSFAEYWAEAEATVVRWATPTACATATSPAPAETTELSATTTRPRRLRRLAHTGGSIFNRQNGVNFRPALTNCITFLIWRGADR
jgi:hypothetical protein